MMQPFAWLVTNGYLKIDDRTWSTMHRGPVAIHASKKFHGPYYDFVRKNLGWPMPAPKDFDYGGVVGVAELVDCTEPTAPIGSRMTKIDTTRAHFGAPGHYGFVLANARALPFKEYRGKMGFFDVSDRVMAELMNPPAAGDA